MEARLLDATNPTPIEKFYVWWGFAQINAYIKKDHIIILKNHNLKKPCFKKKENHNIIKDHILS